MWFIHYLWIVSESHVTSLNPYLIAHPAKRGYDYYIFWVNIVFYLRGPEGVYLRDIN